MKLTVLQENLKNTVSLTSHFISPKAQLPILGNILLRANKSHLELSATNLETSITTSIAAKIEKEGEITVNGKTLNDIISNLSSGQIEIEAEKEQLKLKSGSFKSSILGSNASDFPTLPKGLSKDSIKLNLKDFNTSLSKTLFAVSTDETRPILTGVLLLSTNKKLTLVSTDGFRLTEIKTKVDFPDLKLIIPKTILNEINKFTDEETLEFSFDKENNQIVFKIGDTILCSRIIEGEFPDYQKIIPTASVITINVDKNEFEKAIKLASVFSRDSGNIIKLIIKNEELIIKAESSSSGNQETRLEIRNEDSKENKEIEVLFNHHFIEDVLKVIEDDEIQIVIAHDNKACKFLDPKASNFLHIIMPIKTRLNSI